MRLIYTPEDGEKREFEFVPRKLMSPEAEAIENVGGDAWDSFDEFGMKFMKGNRRAYRAALWAMLKRTDPTLKFRDLSIRVDEIDVQYDQDEKNLLREAIDADPDIDEDQRAYLITEIDKDGPDPKDGTPESDTTTDSTSPRRDSPTA